jgi:hypothetical protein
MVNILGYCARCPSGAYAYWCGACWMILHGRAEFLLPDDPAASEPVMADSPDAERAYCMACRMRLRDGRYADDTGM